MRDVLIVALIYSALFVILTTPVAGPIGTWSMQSIMTVHHLAAEIVFWLATFYICASSTYGAFVRQDRFALSQFYPLLNRVLSILLVISPFLAVFVNVRFVFVLLGLLLLSHIRSKTEDEQKIDFTRSRTLSNMLLLPLFTLALMLMNINGYYVSSIFNFESLNTPVEQAVLIQEEGQAE
jgi:hypothetical protein